MDRAQRALSRGQLERAQGLLAGSTDPEAAALLRQVQLRLEGRVALEAKIQAALAALDGGDLGAMQTLRDLAPGAIDPWEKNAVAVAISRAADLQARSGGVPR